MATFVLVHGSWHGSWAWKRLRPLLIADGHDVFAPTLAGCAERFDPREHSVTLGTHIQELADTLRFEDLVDVVLVGHSYGATLLPAVASLEPQRIRHLIYLDGSVVDPGQASEDMWTDEQRSAASESMKNGYPFRDPLPPETLGISGEADQQWVSDRLTPHPLSCYSENLPAEVPAIAAIPRSFIQCTAGPLADLFAQHAATAHAKGWPITTLNAPHDSMLTHPHQLAKALVDVDVAATNPVYTA